MRSKVLVAGVCAGLILMVAAAPVFGENFLGKLGTKVKKFTITTDASTIISIALTMAKSTSDADIIITRKVENADGDLVDDVVAEGISAIAAMENVVFGALGATKYTLCVVLAGGPRAGFHMNVTEQVPSDLAQRGKSPSGSGLRVREAGEFSLQGPVADAGDAMLQQLLLSRLASKR